MFGRWFRKGAPEVSSHLTLVAPDGSKRRVLYDTTDAIEAPTWSPDGRWLVFNGDGQLWRLRTDGSGSPEVIDLGGVTDASNDHLVAPDGQTVYFSAQARIYTVPLQGGVARQIAAKLPGQAALECYLHGMARDGQSLCFVGVTNVGKTRPQSICTLDLQTGAVIALAQGMTAVDGPEFSVDGQWIFFNAEPAGSVKGHAQIFRMRRDGTQVEQLTSDARVNWFPHPSPDGQWLMYLSYPEKTQGHPANLPVVLRSMPASGGAGVDVATLQGGQGTTNCNGWAPDSQQFAYMAYPPCPPKGGKA